MNIYKYITKTTENITIIEPIEQIEIEKVIYNSTLTPIIKNYVSKEIRYNSSFKIQYTPISKEDSCYYISDKDIEDYGLCNGEFKNINFKEDGEYWITVYEQGKESIGHSKIMKISWDI